MNLITIDFHSHVEFKLFGIMTSDRAQSVILNALLAPIGSVSYQMCDPKAQ